MTGRDRAAAAPPRPPAPRAPAELTLHARRGHSSSAAPPTSPTGSPPTAARRSRATEALPIETNQLYTTYVDLRAADLRRRSRRAGAPAAAPRRPACRATRCRTSVAGLAAIVEDARRGARLDDEARGGRRHRSRRSAA